MKKTHEQKQNPKKKHPGGRPRKVIDWEIFDELCKIQCTEKEICAVMNIDDKTLAAACKREFGLSFSEIYKEKRTGGKASLRRSAWKMAQENPALMIFHLKNHLGMADKTEISIPNQINIKVTE